MTRAPSGFRPTTRRRAAWLCMILAGCGGPSEGDPLPKPGDRPTSIGPPSDLKSPPLPAAKSPPGIEGDRMAGQIQEAADPSTSQEPSPFRFTDIARDAGIDFVHFSGMTEEKHFPTANGSGVAVFDHDGDGRMDLYFATCTLLPPGTARKGPNRLFKNLGEGKFRDVTEASGLGFAGFCHGIVVGDIDNDGDPDVFLCNYGPNALFLNDGHGIFEDISQAAGVDRPAWSSGGAFLDYDGDGDLDLYVANYGEWTYEVDAAIFCGQGKVRLYCSPRMIRTTKHILYRNNGDRTFTDVTDGAGLGRGDGHGFGVVAADLNGDGRVDLYVANDMNPNFLYLNRGDGTFEDATEISGAAFDERGQAQSGMGVDAEDVLGGDGLPELFVTNFANEYNTLYRNLGHGAFFDTTAFVGLAADSVPWVGWGTAMLDFDNDGWPDIFVANGHVDDNRHLLGQPVAHEEPPLLHRNLEGRRFVTSTRDVGPYFASRHVARGAAFGDLDDDGRMDIIVNHKDGAPAVLRNETPGAGGDQNRWIRLRLVGTRSNRDAIGARVEVEAGGRTIVRQRKGGVSMLSAHDPRLLIGLGQAPEIVKVTVRWPSGAVGIHEGLRTDQTHELIEPRAEP